MKRAVLAFLGLFGVGCQPGQPCDSLQGSCLLLQVTGTGTFDSLTATAEDADNNALQIGDVASQVALPANLRLGAVPGVSSSRIQSLRINGIVGGMVTATGETPSPFSWPDGAHIEATVALSAAPPGHF